MFSRLKGRKFSACVLTFILLFVFVAVNTAQEKTEIPNTEQGALKKNIITEETHPNKNPYVRLVAPDKLNNPEVTKNIQRPMTTEVGTPPWEIDGMVSTQTNGQFGSDTYISDLSASTGDMVDPSLATAPNGNIYCAYERRGAGNPYIRVNYSSDGGATWNVVNQIYNASADLTQPSITCTKSKMLVLYTVDDGGGSTYIQAANAPYGSSTITVRTIGTGYNSDSSDPHVFTDNPCYAYGGGSGSDSAFAVWEDEFAAGNVNTSFYRTANSGDTWINGTWIIGSTDSYEWKDPHGSFGNSTSHYLYVTLYDKTNNNLGLIWSTAWGDGTDWQNKTLATLTYPPLYDCNPSIAAAVTPGNSRATVCFANGSADGDDDVGYMHTYDNGSSWFGVYTLTGTTTVPEVGPVNYPDQTGHYFHLVYTHWTNKVYYSRRTQIYSGSTGWSSIRQVNDTSGSGWASVNYDIKGLACSDWAVGFPAIAWTDGGYHVPYRPYFNRIYPDDLVGTWSGQGVYFRTESGAFINIATPATMIATGDIDDDSTDDLLGVWPGQGGVWVNYSDSGIWSALGTTPTCIASGDMNGDGRDDLVGSWTGQGVYYRNSANGAWILMGTPATMIATGDLDNDGIDDLLGVWPGQGGIWIKKSSDSLWEQLGTTPTCIASGDMNGNGRDDLVGSWTGQGVYYRNSATGAWVLIGTPATLIETGDLDADGTDDLLGVWPAQSGSWVKYSFSNDWELLSTTPVDISGGVMRGGPNSWLASMNEEFELLPAPEGGTGKGPGYVDNYVDLRDRGPGGRNFRFQSQKNTVPRQEFGIFQKYPGPGQFGFTFTYQKNTVPKQKIKKKK